jgi:hypothetical protein
MEGKKRNALSIRAIKRAFGVCAIKKSRSAVKNGALDGLFQFLFSW